MINAVYYLRPVPRARGAQRPEEGRRETHWSAALAA